MKYTTYEIIYIDKIRYVDAFSVAEAAAQAMERWGMYPESITPIYER